MRKQIFPLILGLFGASPGIQAATLYVSLTSTNPTAPYADWSTAATDIQSAVDAGHDGDIIVVNDGIYETGGRVVYGSLTNRVAVNKALTLQSVNGPGTTLIVGYQNPTNVVGDDAVRCLYLTNGAAMAGFTFTNGATRGAGDGVEEQSGGGVWCESTNVVITNCVVAACVAAGSGGGIVSGTLRGCTLTANSAYGNGGGASGSTMQSCLLMGNDALYNGGGVDGGSLFDCVLASNTVSGFNGGGASSSTLERCTLQGNYAEQAGGGAIYSLLTNCVVHGNVVGSGGAGGGAYGSELDRCRITANTALGGDGFGGGCCFCTANDSLLTGNLSDPAGGGAMYGTLNNCTVVSNTAGAYAGGAGDCAMNNCVVYFNSSPDGENFALDGEVSGSLNYCCIPDVPAGVGGVGNITNDPALADLSGGDFHLATNSPCINSGRNAYVSSLDDFDGNPRIVSQTVDMGAYECQASTSILSYAWAQRYGVPTDGSADYLDEDHTGMNNWQKSAADLNPTNPASVLVMLPLAGATNGGGLSVRWQSVSTRSYFVQRATNLMGAPAFSTIQAGVAGEAGTTGVADASATNGGPYFYRVGVE